MMTQKNKQTKKVLPSLLPLKNNNGVQSISSTIIQKLQT